MVGKMCKLIVEGQTFDGRKLELNYLLFENPVVQKFISLLKKSLTPDGLCAMKNTVIVKSSMVAQRENAINRLRDLTLELSGKHWILNGWKTWPDRIDQSTLNALHYCFETFERENAISASSDICMSFAALNRQIHLVEGLLDNSCGFDSSCPKVFFSSEPLTIETEVLEESDYDHIEIQLKPGRLYMGYYTIGKNFLTIYRQNDLSLVQQRKVAPQTRANTQIVGLLGANDIHLISNGELIRDFFNWWDKNRIDEFGYDRKNKAILALGWFPLGQLDFPSAQGDSQQFFELEDIKSMRLYSC